MRTQKKNMGNRYIVRLLILILCIVLFNIVLTVYWLVMDNNNLKKSNFREPELMIQADYSDQVNYKLIFYAIYCA